MVIDFHAHAFADKIAETAMTKISTSVPQIIPSTDGTLGGLLEQMNKNGIAKSVVLPIATKPSQQEVVNNWAASVMSDRVNSFGSIHPEADDALEMLENIKNLGLYGIKLHPDYQDFFADEKRLFPIYQKCSELKLPIVFHVGFDPVSPNIIHGTPKMFAEVLNEFPDLCVILAHLGGMNMWDDVEKYLVGKDVYFDVSMCFTEISDCQFKRILKNHGSEKLLFATDIPWDIPQRPLQKLHEFALPKNDLDNILYKNAQKILGV